MERFPTNHGNLQKRQGDKMSREKRKLLKHAEAIADKLFHPFSQEFKHIMAQRILAFAINQQEAVIQEIAEKAKEQNQPTKNS